MQEVRSTIVDILFDYHHGEFDCSQISMDHCHPTSSTPYRNSMELHFDWSTRAHVLVVLAQSHQHDPRSALNEQ